MAAYQNILYSRIENFAPEAVFEDVASPFSKSMEVIAMAGLGNPTPFTDWLKQSYNVVDELIYDDHHKYSSRDYREIGQASRPTPQSGDYHHR